PGRLAVPGVRAGRLVRQGTGRRARLRLPGRPRRARGAPDHHRRGRPDQRLWRVVGTARGAVDRRGRIDLHHWPADGARLPAGARLMKEALTDWGFAAAWRLVRAMPQSTAAAVFRAGADRAARKRGPGVQRLQRNLTRVMGESPSDEVLREAVRS